MSNADKLPVVVIAAMPPPVTGMTSATKHVVQRLRERGDVTVWTTSGGDRPPGVQRHVRRALRYFLAIFVLAGQRIRGVRHLYLVANSGSGLWFDIGMLTVARLLRYQTTMHHHVYAYINRPDRRMAWLDRSLRRGGAHVFLSEGMRDDFVERYSSTTKALVAHNPVSVVSQPRTPPSEFTSDRPLRLGLLANLTIEKGVGLAIETFETLHQQGVPVILELAGPERGEEVEQLVARACERYPGRVMSIGPVYGEEKLAYLQRVDVMLFPTQYPNEAQPLVLLEAWSAGAPVLAYNRGCIGGMANPPALHAYQPETHFATEAAAQITHWINDPETYADACTAAKQRTEQMAEQTVHGFDRLIDRLVA
ncbi:MAG: glycosyltransferase family 4 protein [Planctomycetota bacterium]